MIKRNFQDFVLSTEKENINFSKKRNRGQEVKDQEQRATRRRKMCRKRVFQFLNC